MSCSGETEKNEMIKSVMKWQVFLHLAQCQNDFFCFLFEKISFSLPMLLAMLFVNVGKRSNSSSQIFYRKTSVLESFFNKIAGLKLELYFFSVKLGHVTKKTS